MIVGLDRLFRVLKMSGGIVRHVDHGDALLNGFPGTRPETLMIMAGRRSFMRSSW